MNSAQAKPTRMLVYRWLIASHQQYAGLANLLMKRPLAILVNTDILTGEMIYVHWVIDVWSVAFISGQ